MSNKPFNLNESVINSVRSVLVSSQEQEINSLVEQATSLFFAHNKDASKTLPVFVKEYVMKKTMNPTLATICETVAKDNEKNLTETVEGKGPQMLNEAAGSTPRTPRERKLAKLAPPENKITHKDVLVGRGVVAKEEAELVDELNSSTYRNFIQKRVNKLPTDPEKRKRSINAINQASNKLLKRAPDAPKDPWEDPKFYNAQFKNRQESTDTPGNSYKHQCAIHVKHEQFGEGKTIFSQHAEPDQDGNIAWYDVMFEHGIEKKVSINEIQVLQSESHMMHKKKKMKEEVEQVDETSKGKMMSYVRRALDPRNEKSISNLASRGGYEHGQSDSMDNPDAGIEFDRKAAKRSKFVQKAVSKLAKEDIEMVYEAMKWDKTSSFSLPAEDQNTIKGHQEASIWHAKMLAHLSTEPDNPSTRRNKYFFSKRMAHHNGAAHDMQMQGVKEEVEQVNEISNKLKNNYLEKARESLKKSAPFSKEEDKRSTGIARAKGLIPTKEETQLVDEMMSDPETLRADRFAKTTTTPSGRKIVVKKPKTELKVEDVEYVDEAKRGRPRKNPLPAGQAPEEGDKEHFIMQLRKSVSMRGKKDVEFDNGEKMKVPAHVASAVLDQYNSLKTAEQKDRLHKSVSKSPKHIMSHYNNI